MAAACVIVLVLLALWLLGRVRFGARVAYDGETGLRIWLRAAGAMIPLWPRKPKKEKTVKPPKKAPKSVPKALAGTEIPLREKLDLVRELLPVLLCAAGKLRQKVRVQPLRVEVWLPGEEDPAACALLYGRAHGVLGALWPVLDRALDIRDRQVSLWTDFSGTETRLSFTAGVSLTVGQALWIGTYTGVRMILILLKWKQRRGSAQRKAA